MTAQSTPIKESPRILIPRLRPPQGLLDDGVSSVFDGLEASGDASALEHLYLDGNGEWVLT